MKRTESRISRVRVPISAMGLLAMLVVAGACMEGGEDVADVEAAIVLPPQFADARVAGVPSPTALVVTPDRRILVTTQDGKVRVIRDGTLRATPALDLTARLCRNSERGLLGIALDPAFPQTPHIYLFYTFNKSASCASNQVGTSPVNRVSRFTYDVATDLVSPSSELVLIDNILSLNGNHNGGDLHFGADGFLYVSVGDSGCQLNNSGLCGGGNTNASFTSILSGKMLRVAKDGSIPSSNPLVGMSGAVRCGAPGTTPNYVLNNTQRCTEIFSWGLRNPFRFAFKPGTSEHFINDVGQNRWEEIDLGQRGANYGYNTREGFCVRDSTTNCGAPPAGMTNPIHAYGRENGCVSITGAAFVPAGAFGTALDGAYLFGDYGCGTIFKLTSSGGVYTASPFVTELGGSSVVSMAFGPSATGQSLYYTTYAGGGEVRRLDFTGTSNRPPTARLSASPTTGPAPLVVQLDGRASTDPDAGNTLSYRWTFGDGSTLNTTTGTTSHTYAVGTFTASLVVVDNHGATSVPATVVISSGNTPPVITMTSPTAGQLFFVGQTIQLRATATDAEDGTLPGTSLSWTVLKHHDVHTHPFFGPNAGNTSSIVTDGPEDLAAAATNYLEVRVTATDSRGLSSTVTRDLHPREVTLTFQTVPSGLSLLVNNSDTIGTPRALLSWESWPLTVHARGQTDSAGNYFRFSGWSDGGSAERVIITPAADTTYTAQFVPGFMAKINFQPAGTPVPAGYAADTGAVFGARNGFSYGWNLATPDTRDRNATGSLDQRYDTLNHMQKPANPNGVWEIAVPNGTYDVRVVMGDASHFDSVFRLSAEGTLILSGTPTTSQRWIEATAVVTVTDGRLTLSNGAGASNNKLCFIDIAAR